MRLADHVVFDGTDDAGVILDTRESVYLGLNAVGTLMLRAALRFGSMDEVVDHLLDHVDATDATVRAGVGSLIDQLEQRALVTSAPRGDR
ncbi:PqqD family protein [Actinosynnema sp. NPDC059335]|uniref:PqqD family protein n=1 Tax=Actinosynnema sp. NPDC059335 TaxID=3346804 RepID=UPI003673035C